MEGQTKEELKILIARKDEMEKEIASLTKQIENIDEVSQFSSGIIDP
jgi:transposase